MDKARLQQLAGILVEGRAGADRWYRDVIGKAVADAVEWGQQHPHSDPDDVIEPLVNAAMEEFEKGY